MPCHGRPQRCARAVSGTCSPRCSQARPSSPPPPPPGPRRPRHPRHLPPRTAAPPQHLSPRTATPPRHLSPTRPQYLSPRTATPHRDPVPKDSNPTTATPVPKDSKPATTAATPVLSTRSSAGAQAPADLFELPPARRMDAYGPRPDGVPQLSRAQIVEFGLQNPLIRAADAQVEQLEAVLLKARFAWVPVIKTTTALAPGFQTRCDDLTLPASDALGTTTPIDFQFCRPPGGVDIDTVGGYFKQLAGAGVTVRFNADFVVPLYTFGKIKNGKAMARAGVALAQLAKERARQETILRVYQAHTALLLARGSIGILHEAWSVLQDAKRQIAKELGEGDDADPDEANPDRDPADLIRVELGELTLQERMNAARKIEAVALATLWTIAGEAAPPGFDVSERDLLTDRVAGGLKPVDHYRDLGLKARPEAKMAAGLVDLRKAGEKFARSMFLPDLGVVASVQIAFSNKADRDMRALYYQDRFNYSRLVLALALNWTLDFHNQAFNLKKARAERREAEAQREAANLLLSLEVEKAYRDLLEAEQAVKLTASAIRKAKQLVIDQQLKQTVGGGNFTDLERALTRWAEWRFKHFESIHAQNVALASLSRTVGVSLQDPAGATPPTP
ncbi:MAG: TolC family protein [Nannocystis sp.]|uniref:TolC family protein n=1 Tax=Nannocystis sp. TaxID=1962667 RepID=UPI0024272AB4|nr:TolC family protein [Nannocystis sp.]MBK9754436.1 TolC family protein [Nannocystis sp.]